ncbi:TraB/GumN family protein [Oxalobacteraceae bacterium A2-2]
MPKFLRSILLALVLGQSAAHAVYAVESVEISSEAVQPRRGALYRVQHEGKTSYLFGTIHVGKDAFYPLEPVVSRALQDSRALVIELDIREEQPFQLALARHGRYPEGDSVQRHLSRAALDKLVTALARAGVSLQSVQQYKPWLIANMLVGMEMERHGYQRSQGVEYALLDVAQKQSKAVRELESADYQLSLFDQLDEQKQETYMLENLADLEDGNSLKKSQELIEAWSRADRPRIDGVLRELTKGKSVSAAFMHSVLLGQRNPEMATSIERIMQQDQVAFVGVGLLHLVGDEGVPQLLKRRGYQVEQLY